MKELWRLEKFKNKEGFENEMKNVFMIQIKIIFIQ